MEDPEPMPRHNFISLPSRMSGITKASKNVSWLSVLLFCLFVWGGCLFVCLGVLFLSFC